MPENDAPEYPDSLSVQDMQDWLHEQIRDSGKAHELRVKDATEFVMAYAAGKLNPEEAFERLYQHDRCWGEALFGATATPGLSDEAIVKKIDEARKEMFRTRSKGFLDGQYGKNDRSR